MTLRLDAGIALRSAQVAARKLVHYGRVAAENQPHKIGVVRQLCMKTCKNVERSRPGCVENKRGALPFTFFVKGGIRG